MREKQSPFTVLWYVAEQHKRVSGDWIREYDFEPEERIIAFFKNGYYGEIIRSDRNHDKIEGMWFDDADTGIISIYSGRPDIDLCRLCVLDESEQGVYIYFFEDAVHIRHERELIIKYHAHERLKVEKVR